MDELTMVARLRGDVTAEIDLAGPELRLAEEIAATVGAPAETAAMSGRGLAGSPVPRASAMTGNGRAFLKRRLRRTFAATAAAAAVAAAVAVVVSVAGTGNPSTGTATSTLPAPDGNPRPIATAAELVADATRAAQMTPDAPPSPDAWVYYRTEEATSASEAQNGTLLGPANGTVVSAGWSRAAGGGASVPGTWQGSTYSYFSSLPTNPAKLAAVIEANNKTDNYLIGGGYLGIFNVVEETLEQPMVLPLKLRAALYAVLAREPGVNFEPHVTDIAGRTDVALFIDQEGYLRSEILIDPRTYSYMGRLDVAYRAHALPAQITNGVASGPYTHIRAGQIIDEEALLQFRVVQHYGQVPR